MCMLRGPRTSDNCYGGVCMMYGVLTTLTSLISWVMFAVTSIITYTFLHLEALETSHVHFLLVYEQSNNSWTYNFGEWNSDRINNLINDWYFRVPPVRCDNEQGNIDLKDLNTGLPTMDTFLANLFSTSSNWTYKHIFTARFLILQAQAPYHTFWLSHRNFPHTFAVPIS